MAFIHPRRGSQKIYVYYHDRNTGKLKQLPRKLTRHLDGQPREVADQWVREWEEQHGRIVERSNRIHLKEGDKLSGLWKAYQAQKASETDRERRPRTVRTESQNFHNYVVPFFVGEHEKKEPASWHALIPDFHAHLANLKLSARTRQKILWTLHRFGAYLVFTQHMTYPFVVRPPRSKNTKITPLKVRLTPKDVYDFVKTPHMSGNVNFNLAVLLGYFASLSPSELFALERRDFLTGSIAKTKSKTYTGFKKRDLGSALAVVVSKTLESGGVVELTKNDYRTAVVTVWEVKAAKLIAEIVKEMPNGRLFPLALSTLEHLWGKIVKSKLRVTPHDLRRASGLYLGRSVRLDVTLLQEHMRHAEIETTMLYMREPAVPEKTKARVEQDFDDVA